MPRQNEAARRAYQQAYYQRHRDYILKRNALARCEDVSVSHTGYPMAQLDAAYAALEQALEQRRQWKARMK